MSKINLRNHNAQQKSNLFFLLKAFLYYLAAYFCYEVSISFYWIKTSGSLMWVLLLQDNYKSGRINA